MGLLLGASVMTVAEMIELCLEFIPGCSRRIGRHKTKHSVNANGSAHDNMVVPERVVVTE